MDELTIIEVTSEGIVAVSKDGQRFLLPLDDRTRAQLTHRPNPAGGGKVASPKEIQTLLRAGLTVDEVAERTGTDADHVARFEAPITAELQFILERALAVPVRSELVESTFGLEIEERIGEQGGTISLWQAYRSDDRWVIGARFSVGAALEDATWVFDPRKMTLHPDNQVAVRMSSADAADAALFPPLRVVQPEQPSRFDSGEFEPLPVVDAPVTGIIVDVEPSSTDSVVEPPAPVDLLETLQRKRGERNDAISSHPSTGSIPIITPDMLEMPDDAPIAPTDVPEVQVNDTAPITPATPDTEPFIDPTPSRTRRQRAQMPTWDEIVFGTRPDED